MKVLMLGWELPPHNSGGLGVACYQLCKALSSKGADIEFVLPYTAEHDVDFMRVSAAHPQDVTEVLQAGIAYDSYRYTHADGRIEWLDMFGQQELYERSVERLVDLLEFDVIHAHDWLTFRAALRAKQKSGKPLIAHVHSVERDRAGGNPGNPFVREIEGLSLMMADRVVAVSQHTRRMISEDYGIPQEKIEVVHNSIDPATVVPAEGDNAYRYLARMKAAGYRVVVNVGRLTLQKGLPNLIRAMASVVDRNPKVMLLIVGSGEQEYELLALAAELGISRNVIFTGFQRGKNWRDAYAIGDLFVMPSVSEPFGLTPLEAISYGTPALISRQSGVAEILNNALKVDFWDVDEMANQIAAVVGNDSLRDELHANSYREYVKLNWNGSADRLMELYRKHHMGAAV
jgi:glycogen synthase